MVKISNCPITGLERMITAKDLLVLERDEQLVLRCFISHFKNGELIENARITDYSKDLIATDKTPVDKTTGDKLASFDEPNAIGQYSFFKYLTTVPVSIEKLELKYIADNDEEGNFDI